MRCFLKMDLRPVPDHSRVIAADAATAAEPDPDTTSKINTARLPASGTPKAVINPFATEPVPVTKYAHLVGHAVYNLNRPLSSL